MVDNTYTPPEGYIRISSVSGFNYCPLRFKKTNIYNERTPDSKASILGNIYHDLMELYFKSENFNLDKVPEPVKPLITWTIELEKKREKLDNYYPPKDLELRIKNDELKLTGTIDRVDWYDYGKSVSILDYKTGSKVNVPEVKAQMTGYGILYQLEYEYEVKELVAIYPKLKEFYVFKFNKQAIKLFASRVGKIKYAMETNNFPDKCSVNKWQYCKLCEFKKVVLKQ